MLRPMPIRSSYAQTIGQDRLPGRGQSNSIPFISIPLWFRVNTINHPASERAACIKNRTRRKDGLFNIKPFYAHRENGLRAFLAGNR